ncbi:MAG: hypothetical protein ACPGVW_09410, partial [Pseudoalteromonas marina]
QAQLSAMQKAEQNFNSAQAETQAQLEATRQQAIAKAQAQGYSVKEKHINGKVQLVCIRHI